MEYLRLFENHTEYEAFANGGNMLKPNVSHCVAENDVHYNGAEASTIITLEMTGGDSLVFNVGTKSDGTSLEGFILRTGETVEIIQGPITVHLENDDTTGGYWNFRPMCQYTTNSGDTYSEKVRWPLCHETITFTPLEDTTFWADID